MLNSLDLKTSCKTSMPNFSSFFYRILLICLILNFQDSGSVPVKSNYNNQLNTNINLSQFRRSAEEMIFGQIEDEEPTFEEFYDKLKLQDEEEDLIMDNSVKKKEYDELFIEPVQDSYKPKKHNTIIKADRFKQRVEKKSWKIPMKTLALYTENSHQNMNNHMLDELTEVFNSFKDNRK